MAHKSRWKIWLILDQTDRPSLDCSCHEVLYIFWLSTGNCQPNQALICFSAGRQNCHSLDRTGGLTIPDVQLRQRCVEFRNSSVGDHELRREAVLGLGQLQGGCTVPHYAYLHHDVPGAGCIKVGRTPGFYVGRWVDSRRTRAQRWNGLYQEIITHHKYHWFLRTFYATTSSDVNYRPKLRRTPVTPRLVRLASEWTPDLTFDVSVSLGRTAFMQPAPGVLMIAFPTPFSWWPTA